MTDQLQHQRSPRFSLHSSPVTKHIKALTRYLCTKLVARDKKNGVVYVAKQVGTDFCKVGFANGDAENRLNALDICAIDREASYCTPPANCAFRAEQILHKLLYLSCHHRLHCPCKHENREWYQHNYEEIIHQVQIVYSWLQREPYDMDTGGLKEVWLNALELWGKKRESQTPLGWNDFFLAGPAMPVITGPYCTTPLPPAPVRQVSLSRHSIERLAKMIIERQRLTQKHTQEFELFLGNPDISESPASTSFEVELPIRNEESFRGFSESRRETVDDLEAEPDKPPQFALSSYADIDVAAITADMPGAYPADTTQEASPVASDEFERPESSFFNEVVSVQVNVSQSYIRHSGHSASETVSIKHQFLPQRAASGLERPLALPPIPSSAIVIEAAESPPAGLSSEEQITDARNALFVARPIPPKKIPESSATPATKVVHEEAGFIENLSSDTTPSSQLKEDESLSVDQELSRDLPSFNEVNDENARPNIQASDLAAAKAISADLVDVTSEGDEVEASRERYQSSIDPWGPRPNFTAAHLAARKSFHHRTRRQKLRETSKGKFASLLPMNIFQFQGQLPAADPGQAIRTAEKHHWTNEVPRVFGTRDRPICLDSREKRGMDIPKPTIETEEEEDSQIDEVSELISIRDMPICPDSQENGDKNIRRPAKKIKANSHSSRKGTRSFNASSTSIRAGTLEEDDSDTPRPEKFNAYHYNNKEISGFHNAPATPADPIQQKVDIFHRATEDISINENTTSSPVDQCPVSPVSATLSDPDAPVAESPSEEEDDDWDTEPDDEDSSEEEEELNSADENTCSEYKPSSTCSDVSEPDTPSHRRRGFWQTRTIRSSEPRGLRIPVRRRRW